MSKPKAVKEAEENLRRARRDLNDFHNRIREERKREFFMDGGCQECWGSGSVRVADENLRVAFEPCFACDGVQNLWCGSNQNRPKGHKIKNLPSAVQYPHEREEEADLQEDIQMAIDHLETVEAQYHVTKGRRVKYVGRDNPTTKKGDEGEVFWVAGETHRTRDRCGFKDDDGEVHWAHVSEVEVIVPLTLDEVDESFVRKKNAGFVKGLARNDGLKGKRVDTVQGIGICFFAGKVRRGAGPWKIGIQTSTLGKAGNIWVGAEDVTGVGGKTIAELVDEKRSAK